MLPTITAPANRFPSRYQSSHRVSKKSSNQPWGLLALLLVACSIMLFTRHTSTVERNKTVNEEHQKQPEDLIHRKSGGLRRVLKGKSPWEEFESLPAIAAATKEELEGAWKFTQEVYDKAMNYPKAEILSKDNPRLIRFKSFLSPEEAEALVRSAADKLKRSHVVASNVSQQVDNARTSFGAWPPRDEFMQKIEQRIHNLVGIPREFGESIYVLNYKQDQQYAAHHDNCARGESPVLTDACKNFLKRAGGPLCGNKGGGVTCGDRIATFILMLRAPKKGGRTVFPSAEITKENMKNIQKSTTSPWYCQHDEVLGVTASPGDALLFWDYKPARDQSDIDKQAESVLGALHSGCPVLEGEKWIATRWIRSAKFV